MTAPPTGPTEANRTVRARVVVASLALLLAACAAQTQRAWLQFFFDGVPDETADAEPHLVEPGTGPLRPRRAPGPLSLEERAEFQERRLQPQQYSFHEPYRQKRCDLCHQVRRNGDWMQGTPVLVEAQDRLCGRCHALPDLEFVHGPVATASCQLCHEHHAGPHDHLLKQKEVRALCTQCHNGATFTTAKAHEAYGERACTECHDPHASAARFLLHHGRRAAMPKPVLPVVEGR